MCHIMKFGGNMTLSRLVLLGFLAIAAFFLFTEHRAHVLGALPYIGFILIMLGFLLQWPTLPTLLMFPVLVTMYVRLAHREERQALAEFGDVYARYLAATPAVFPRLGRLGSRQT
jgi:hypothetical protein